MFSKYSSMYLILIFIINVIVGEELELKMTSGAGRRRVDITLSGGLHQDNDPQGEQSE